MQQYISANKSTGWFLSLTDFQSDINVLRNGSTLPKQVVAPNQKVEFLGLTARGSDIYVCGELNNFDIICIADTQKDLWDVFTLYRADGSVSMDAKIYKDIQETTVVVTPSYVHAAQTIEKKIETFVGDGLKSVGDTLQDVLNLPSRIMRDVEIATVIIVIGVVVALILVAKNSSVKIAQ